VARANVDERRMVGLESEIVELIIKAASEWGDLVLEGELHRTALGGGDEEEGEGEEGSLLIFKYDPAAATIIN
jgi:hypothetical protein